MISAPPAPAFDFLSAPITTPVVDGLFEALNAIRQEQLVTGEIPSYRRGSNDTLQYQRSPLLTTYVHDALGYFDPRSPWWSERSLQVIPDELRGQFLWTLVKLRRQLRAFLVWQAEPDGTWRFFGRGSGLGPDSTTTSAAATALLEFGGVAGPAAERDRASRRNRRSLSALARFRAEDGRYFTFLDARGRGYGWMNAVGHPLVGFDRVVNADVLRFLGLVGPEAADQLGALTDFVLDELEHYLDRSPSQLFPNPLCFAYAVARAWTQAGLPGWSDVADRLLPLVLAQRDPAGAFDGPLSTALAACVLLDLDYAGPELDLALESIRRGRQRWGGWEYEEFLIGGFGSPAWTTALSMVVLARGQFSSGAGQL